MNFVNPHFFSAVLENIPHRFILIQECEYLNGYEGFQPPRFSVGAINATRDPRYAQFRQLLPVGVSSSALQIPPSWLMAHQYIYIVHEKTDKVGWQYRSTWPSTAIPSPKEEQWVKDYISHFHFVRRRVWMTTIVQRVDLVQSKRLLSDNVHVDHGSMKLQGELFRYEKGTLTKAWNKRRVILHHNRIEFYSGTNKKGEIALNECEVKMLTPDQCQGRQFAFSIRNPTGSVGILLDADNQDSRRDWVLAIQYQLAINSDEMNFVPMEYAPPTGGYPDNRVMLSSDLKMLGKDGKVWLPRHFQLLPREIVCFNEGDDLKGRIFVEQATITPDDKDQRRFNITSSTGISLNLSSDSSDVKREWLEGVKKQVDTIENQKLKQKTVPKEELNDDNVSPVQKMAMFYEDNWMAPAVDGEDEEYLSSIFTAPYRNNPDHFEFNEDLGITLDPRLNRSISRDRSGTVNNDISSSTSSYYQSKVSSTSITTTTTTNNVSSVSVVNNFVNNNNTAFINHVQQAASPVQSIAPYISNSDKSNVELVNPRPLPSPPAITKYLGSKRILLNPRFMLSCLKSINHRFVLVLECEFHNNASREVQASAPPRFSVGGPRASKDPRTVMLNQLLGISNRNPEIQFPPGWFTLHPYIYIVQQNTDDNGWQYRSTWSEGNVAPNDEPWNEVCDANKFVRRRMWMTTVVRKDDMMKAKKLAVESINRSSEDAIYQENLSVCQPPDISASHVASQGSAGASPISIGLVKGKWEQCKVLLYHKKLEFYNGHDKVGDVNIMDCEVRTVDSTVNSIAEGREHVFAIQHLLSQMCIYFQCENAASRLRWMNCLTYQILLISPDLNFDPLVVAPPTGELPQQRVLYCGDLQISDSIHGRWDMFQIQLQEQTLLCFHRSDGALYGKLLLEGASVRGRDEENEFTLKINTGFQIHLRAENVDSRLAWTSAIRRCVENIRLKKRSIIANISLKERTKQFQDKNWNAIEFEQLAEEDYMHTLRERYFSDLGHSWPNMPVVMPVVSRQNSSSNPNVDSSSKRNSRDLSVLATELPSVHSRSNSNSNASTVRSNSLTTLPTDMSIDLNRSLQHSTSGTSTTSTSSNTAAPEAFSSKVATPTSRSDSKLSVKSYIEDDDISDADFEVPFLSKKLTIAGQMLKGKDDQLQRSGLPSTVSSVNESVSNTTPTPAKQSLLAPNPQSSKSMNDGASDILHPFPTMRSPVNANSSIVHPLVQQSLKSPSSEDSVISSSADIMSASFRPSSTSGSADETEQSYDRRKIKPSDVELRPVDKSQIVLSPPAKLTSSVSLPNVELRHIESNDEDGKKVKRFTLPSINLRPISLKKEGSEDEDWDKDFPVSNNKQLPGKLSIPVQLRPVSRGVEQRQTNINVLDEARLRRFDDGSAISPTVNEHKLDIPTDRIGSVRDKIRLFGGEKGKSPVFPKK